MDTGDMEVLGESGHKVQYEEFVDEGDYKKDPQQTIQDVLSNFRGTFVGRKKRRMGAAQALYDRYPKKYGHIRDHARVERGKTKRLKERDFVQKRTKVGDREIIQFVSVEKRGDRTLFRSILGRFVKVIK